MTAGPAICVRLRITGRVQGVWFRAWAMEQAEELGLDGWVRNRRDGSVEAVVHGPVERIEEMAARCRIGPPAARVERLETTREAEPVAPGFHQKPTA